MTDIFPGPQEIPHQCYGALSLLVMLTASTVRGELVGPMYHGAGSAVQGLHMGLAETPECKGAGAPRLPTLQGAGICQCMGRLWLPGSTAEPHTPHQAGHRDWLGGALLGLGPGAAR